MLNNKKIIIDVGMPKTGSSSRQKFYKSLEGQLSLGEFSFVYLDTLMIGGMSCDRFYDILRNGSSDSLISFVGELLKIDNNIVVSHEGICLLPLRKIEELVEAFTHVGYSIEFRQMVRTFETFIPSWYRQCVADKSIFDPLHKVLYYHAKANPGSLVELLYPSFSFHEKINKISLENELVNYKVTHYRDGDYFSSFDFISYLGLGDSSDPMKESSSVVTRLNISESFEVTHINAFVNHCFISNVDADLLNYKDLYYEYFGDFDDSYLDILKISINEMINIIYSRDANSRLSNSAWVNFFPDETPSDVEISDFVNTLIADHLRRPVHFESLMISFLLNQLKLDNKSDHFMHSLNVLTQKGDSYFFVIDKYPDFNPFDYLLINPDVFAAGVNAYDHFLNKGLSEGRSYNR